MGRLLIWNVSTEIVAGNLWMGIGFDNFKSCYMNKQADFSRLIPMLRKAWLQVILVMPLMSICRHLLRPGLLALF